MKEFVVYTLARFGLFLAIYGAIIGVYAVVAGTPIPVLWPLLLAAVLSTIASVYLLRGMRERFTLSVHERAGRISQKFDEMKAKEDVD